jgi:drug/metabolite transporter (DMT)-like permease
MKTATVYFWMFCILLAGRDSFTQLLGMTVHPVPMLVVFCWTSTIVAWLFGTVRTGIRSPFSIWRRLEVDQRWALVRLGLATWGVYAATVWGVVILGASVFNIVDYAAMPILTIGAGALLLGEDRPSMRNYAWGVVGIIGVGLLYLADSQRASEIHGAPWEIGVSLALVSPLLTSYCSAVQKDQVDRGLHPDEILMFRFPLPATLMTVWYITGTETLRIGDLPGLVAVGVIGMFLPLLLLCYGFMTSSLRQFSSYLFLVPLLTLLVVPTMIEGEWERLTEWCLVAGGACLACSYIFSMFSEWRR